MSEASVLFGTAGADRLHFTLHDAVEEWWDGGGAGTVVIEEWCVVPTQDHLPAAYAIAEWIHDTACDSGDVDEGWCNEAQSAPTDGAVLTAAQALLDVFADCIGYRMADSVVARHTVEVEDRVDQLVYAVKEAERV